MSSFGRQAGAITSTARRRKTLVRHTILKRPKWRIGLINQYRLLLPGGDCCGLTLFLPICCDFLDTEGAVEDVTSRLLPACRQPPGLPAARANPACPDHAAAISRTPVMGRPVSAPCCRVQRAGTDSAVPQTGPASAGHRPALACWGGRSAQPYPPWQETPRQPSLPLYETVLQPNPALSR